MSYIIASPIHYNVFEFVSLHEGGGGDCGWGNPYEKEETNQGMHPAL